MAAPPLPETPVLSKKGALTEEQRAQVTAWVKEKWTNGDCPFHGTTSWTIGPTIVATIPYVGGPLTIGGPTYPLAVAICNTCGFTVFINAITVGIVKVDQESGKAVGD